MKSASGHLKYSHIINFLDVYYECSSGKLRWRCTESNKLYFHTVLIDSGPSLLITVVIDAQEMGRIDKSLR